DLSPITYPTDSSDIVVSVRDVVGNNGPSDNISIHHNIALAKGKGQKFVTANTTSGSGTNTSAGRGLWIEDNRIFSLDTNNYYSAVLAMSGANAGYGNTHVSRNYFLGAPIVHAGSNLYDGAIGFTAAAGKPVQKIQISAN